jgi:hypothetical protein
MDSIPIARFNFCNSLEIRTRLQQTLSCNTALTRAGVTMNL